MTATHTFSILLLSLFVMVEAAPGQTTAATTAPPLPLAERIGMHALKDELDDLLRDIQSEYVLPSLDEDERSVEAAWDEEINRRAVTAIASRIGGKDRVISTRRINTPSTKPPT